MYPWITETGEEAPREPLNRGVGGHATVPQPVPACRTHHQIHWLWHGQGQQEVLLRDYLPVCINSQLCQVVWKDSDSWHVWHVIVACSSFFQQNRECSSQIGWNSRVLREENRFLQKWPRSSLPQNEATFQVCYALIMLHIIFKTSVLQFNSILVWLMSFRWTILQ